MTTAKQRDRHRPTAKRSECDAPRNTAAPADTEQAARDLEEKRKHPSEENALDSAQDKNPVLARSSKGR